MYAIKNLAIVWRDFLLVDYSSAGDSLASGCVPRAALPPAKPAMMEERSMPVDSFIPSIIWFALFITSRTTFVELPSPYITILSVRERGDAAFLTTSGRAVRYISRTDASPIFF